MNHTGASSGAEFALMRLVEGLKAEHSVAVACPGDGPLAEIVETAGIRRVPVPAFEASLRLDPVQTPVGVARLAAGLALRCATARVPARRGPRQHSASRAHGRGCLQHAGGPPLVVRAHEHLPPTPMGRAVRLVLSHSASAVVTVSKDTAKRFDEGTCGGRS